MGPRRRQYAQEKAVGGIGGADRARTDDLLLAKQLLFQLSYGPAFWVLIFR